ncbi:hypothetical protein BASA50_009814 [Batrachochytrium salamandrivorans]|uniref:C2H2-type domain-containing protein n=1 Tax=Batrachochytrium salamandrivorans TaxID=1357716 RepID=A0ABQ8F394_9FUNG|nr:hypothetical protein BASA60_011238 [Batrachochytrium salamandrivorans]KAH6568534.1 hypothetical protein BASA62_005424 [Batrachochytrium salamandrivorans]KAH6581780.1 hypothetical protein BASA61_008887 [Batrachochytrium salamandrivorans]KAH6589722.1 hypothetical protein BASA50_009814 [Batrachochytrium salamandrivorans]KAH9247884.1 hypothetical protein BASA81_014481 [Batrachochytrium salamandrivorans]
MVKTARIPPELEAAIGVYGEYHPLQNKDRPFHCTHCTRSYRKLSGLIGHHQAIHVTTSETDTEADAKPFQCTIDHCGKSYLNAGGLAYHLENGHFVGVFSDTLVKKPNSRTKRQPPMEDTSRRMLTCPHAGCCKRYKTVNGLAYHLKKGKFSGHPTSSHDINAEDALLESLMANKRAANTAQSRDGNGCDIKNERHATMDWDETTNDIHRISGDTPQDTSSHPLLANRSKRRVNSRPLYNPDFDEEQKTHDDILAFLQSMVQQRSPASFCVESTITAAAVSKCNTKGEKSSLENIELPSSSKKIQRNGS